MEKAAGWLYIFKCGGHHDDDIVSFLLLVFPLLSTDKSRTLSCNERACALNIARLLFFNGGEIWPAGHASDLEYRWLDHQLQQTWRIVDDIIKGGCQLLGKMMKYDAVVYRKKRESCQLNEAEWIYA